MPTAETCLGCQNQVWNAAAQFAPLRTALALGAPVAWSSVHRLPDHVRFHHSAHTAASIACETCHGRVWEMPHTAKAETLSVGECIDCHREPATRQRPVSAVFDREWSPSPGMTLPPLPQPAMRDGIEISPLTRCSMCHR